MNDYSQMATAVSNGKIDVFEGMSSPVDALRAVQKDWGSMGFWALLGELYKEGFLDKEFQTGDRVLVEDPTRPSKDTVFVCEADIVQSEVSLDPDSKAYSIAFDNGCTIVIPEEQIIGKREQLIRECDWSWHGRKKRPF